MARRNNPVGPTFSQRHNIRVAQILNSVQPTKLTHALAHGDAMAQWERTCLAFINRFRQDNSKFSSDTFLKACKGDDK